VVPVKSVITFQIARGSIFIIILAIIYASAAMTLMIKKRAPVQALIAIGIFLCLFTNFHIEALARPGTFDVNGRHRYKNWIDVQIWAADNTPKDADFIIPPQKQGFRIYAKRSIFADWKDGTMASFSTEFGELWLARMHEFSVDPISQLSVTEGYEKLKTQDFLRIAKQYGQDYVVVDSQQRLSLPEVHGNAEYRIYKLF
jgi:hypothetical protein